MKRYIKLNEVKINPRYNEYFSYIKEHRLGVWDSWIHMLKPVIEPYTEEHELYNLEQQILTHDLSKYSKEEFIPYLNWFYPTDDFPKDVHSFDLAWLHHQNVNLHHWQYYVLIQHDKDKKCKPLDMDLFSILEMLCDWHSFSREDNSNTAYLFYNENKDNILISNLTRSTVEEYIEYLKEPLKPSYAENNDDTELSDYMKQETLKRYYNGDIKESE